MAELWVCKHKADISSGFFQSHLSKMSTATIKHLNNKILKIPTLPNPKLWRKCWSSIANLSYSIASEPLKPETWLSNHVGTLRSFLLLSSFCILASVLFLAPRWARNLLLVLRTVTITAMQSWLWSCNASGNTTWWRAEYSKKNKVWKNSRGWSSSGVNEIMTNDTVWRSKYLKSLDSNPEMGGIHLSRVFGVYKVVVSTWAHQSWFPGELMERNRYFLGAKDSPHFRHLFPSLPQTWTDYNHQYVSLSKTLVPSPKCEGNHSKETLTCW